MGDVIKLFPAEEEKDIHEMTEDELRSFLKFVREEIDRLNAHPPEHEEDDEGYEEDWAEDHERLEDLYDEILELLDEMN